jgi:hypothetical protein
MLIAADAAAAPVCGNDVLCADASAFYADIAIVAGVRVAVRACAFDREQLH